MPSAAEIAQILEREGIKIFEKDLRRFSLEEISEHFGAVSSGRIILTKVIKNLVWQAVCWIREGRIEGIEGNLRSFFYQWVKPVMARIPGALEQERDPYDTMLDVFVELVEKYRLFEYADLDLVDDNWEHRRVGERFPHLFVFSEKTGFFRLLRKLHEEHDVTVVALGGFPSLLSSEYLVRELREATELERSFVAFSIVDWDPAGYQIARSFLSQLGGLGLAQFQHEPLIRPEHYTQEEVQLFRYPLPTRQRTKNQNWLEETGGIEGELFGLEADSMPRSRLRDLLREKLNPYLQG